MEDWPMEDWPIEDWPMGEWPMLLCWPEVQAEPPICLPLDCIPPPADLPALAPPKLPEAWPPWLWPKADAEVGAKAVAATAVSDARARRDVRVVVMIRVFMTISCGGSSEPALPVLR